MASKFGGNSRVGNYRASATVEASHAAQGVNELRQELKSLRLVVLEMLDAQVSGEPVDLTTPAVRQLLHLSEQATAEQAAARLREMQAPVIGHYSCGCGATVELKQGVADTTCPWCGAVIERPAAEQAIDDE